MKILVVANYHIGLGGISGVVKNHMAYIRKEGYTVELFNTRRNNIIRLFLIIPLLFKVRKFDIVHLHGSSNLGFYPIALGIIASKFFYNKRTIVTYHGGGAKPFLEKHNSFIKRILNKADYITVMSGYLEKIFKEFNIETVILRNLIDIEILTDTNINFDTPKLVSIRSLEENYNIEDIIQAFVLVKNKYQNAELKIIGGGSKYNELLGFSKSLNISNIEFKRKISNEDIQKEILKSNIFVTVPSFDNQPMSILEAFATGIPVISSNVGGIPYMINNEENGFLVDINKPGQIAEKVFKIMDNKNLVDKVIENGKKEVSNYQWDSIKSILFKLYGFI